MEYEICTLIQKLFGDKYTNPQECGRGEFSKVYKCQNKNGDFVAIKVNDTQKAANIPDILKNETTLLKKCNNENVIKLIESVELGKAQILVLEFCEMDLQKVRTDYYNNKIPEDIVIVILQQLMNGLYYLHQNKIIHRDLKLENIGVVFRKGDLNYLKNKKQYVDDSIFRNASYKLIDFGFAKQLLEETKTLAGTYFNMAPEVLVGSKYSFSADIYSLGVCLYQMITGQYPYQAKDLQGQYTSIRNQKAKFDTINNKLLRETIQQMLQFDVKKRLTFQQLYSSGLVHLGNSIKQISEFYFINTPNENDDLQESQLSQTEAFSVIQYPTTEIAKSQIQTSQIEFIGLPEMNRWNKQKAICTFIQNFCNKLQNVIKTYPDKIKQFEFQNQFIRFLKYYSKLVEKLLFDLKKDVYQKSHYSNQTSYNLFRDSLENFKLNNYEYQWINSTQDLKILKVDDINNQQDLLSIVQKNNERIFLYISNMLEIIYDMDQELQEFRCNCYLIQCDIVILYAENQNKNTISGDDQFVELKSEDFDRNPVLVQSWLWEMIDDKKVYFEELY
ncbi:unnamed protein product [Paramecium octaurelia]|uniref:Protein kinase domain-containing protein n=1 Tax=Paramecium octaurelia TaxID=43137 RepID=A0A8S1V2U4_PAROT|nr:unnamed protein product [Paramecium octaurelia]